MKRFRRYLLRLTSSDNTEPEQGASSETKPLIAEDFPETPLVDEYYPAAINADNTTPSGKEIFGKVKQRFPYYVPIFSWLPKYSFRNDFAGDLVAGLGVAAMLVPQALAYASLAGLPPAYGLYTSWIPLIMYFLFGTSKQLSIGPDALSSLLVGIAVNEILEKHEDMDAPQAACIITFFVGCILLLLGLLRVGFLDNVLSRPLLCGFINAVALTIVIEQLDPLFGLKPDYSKHGWDRLVHWFRNISGIHWATFGIGFVTIYLIVVVCLYFSASFWLNSLTISYQKVVIGTSVTALAKFDKLGVAILGEVPQGIPKPVAPKLSDVSVVVELLPDAAVISIIGFIEHIVAAKIYAQKHKYQISANRELVALGFVNLIGNFFNAYPTVASLTRSAVADALGARSQVFGLITSFVLMFTILFLGPLFYYLPKVVMAGIIVVAAVGLFELHELIFLFRIRAWRDIILTLVTFVTTIILGIEIGIGISLALSVFLVIKHTTLPHFTILGNIPNTTKYRDVSQHPDAEPIPGILVIRIEEPMYFANIQGIKSILTRIEYLGAPHAHPSESGDGVTKLKAIILHCGNIPTIDASAVQTLKQMTEDYSNRSIVVGLVKPRQELRTTFLRAEMINPGVHIFDSTHEAVEFARTYILNQDKEDNRTTNVVMQIESVSPSSDKQHEDDAEHRPPARQRASADTFADEV